MSTPRFQKGDRIRVKNIGKLTHAGQTGTVLQPSFSEFDPKVGHMHWVRLDYSRILHAFGESLIEHLPDEHSNEKDTDMSVEIDPELALTDPDKYRRLSLARLIGVGLRNGGEVQIGAAGSIWIANLILSDQALAVIGLSDDEVIALRQRHADQRSDAEVVRRRKEAELEQRRKARQIELARLVDQLNDEYSDLEPLQFTGPATAG